MAKDLSDRVCSKCLVRIDRQGNIKEQPANVPDVNPVTGQKNSIYGWAPPHSTPHGGAQGSVTPVYGQSDYGKTE